MPTPTRHPVAWSPDHPGPSWPPGTPSTTTLRPHGCPPALPGRGTLPLSLCPPRNGESPLASQAAGPRGEPSPLHGGRHTLPPHPPAGPGPCSPLPTREAIFSPAPPSRQPALGRFPHTPASQPLAAEEAAGRAARSLPACTRGCPGSLPPGAARRRARLREGLPAAPGHLPAEGQGLEAGPRHGGISGGESERRRRAGRGGPRRCLLTLSRREPCGAAGSADTGDRRKLPPRCRPSSGGRAGGSPPGPRRSPERPPPRSPSHIYSRRPAQTAGARLNALGGSPSPFLSRESCKKLGCLVFGGGIFFFFWFFFFQIPLPNPFALPMARSPGR